ncbi:hypothetical protein JCM11251_004307 [Rhodosporidiobolus azoricus]
MSKPTPTPRKKNTVPVALVLEPSPACEQLLTAYCSSVITSLQTLHPQTQLVFTAVTPSSHAIALNPFLPPAAFLAALPSFIRRPARPTSTIWRSTTGLLRAIKLARRRLLEGQLAGAGGEGKGQLPKYVVVISGTDVENMGGDEVWLEDDDQKETWESVAKNFTRGQHCTTLFSLISLGHTPNLETFWRESSGKFPPNLVYNSLGTPPSSGFTFPLLSPSHAALLIGFYNNNARNSSQTNGGAPSPAGTSNKRAAPPDPAQVNKKVKPNPPTMPGTSVSPQLANASLANRQQPTPPNPSRNLAPPNGSPQIGQQKPPLATGPLNNENIQQYINDMKAAAARNGQPPPTAAEIQAAALNAYRNGSLSNAPGGPGPRGTPRMNNPALSPALGGAGVGGPAPGTPQLPPDMKMKIEMHLTAIKSRVAKGELSSEEAASQVKRLQEFANQARQQMVSQQQQNGNANQGQGLGLNIPLAPGLVQQQPPQQQHQQQNRGPQQQQPQPQRQDFGESNRPKTIWRGPISFAFLDNAGSGTAEYTMYCQAAPLQQSAVADLANVKLPPSFRISSLVRIKMPALQQIAAEHTLPAINITPIPAEVLPKELRDKQTLQSGGHSNEALYSMLSASIESRSTCGIVRFSGTPHGLVLVAVPNQSKILGLVFTKIPLPEAWTKQNDASAPVNAPPQQQQQQQHQRVPSQQSQLPPRPPSAQSGMFSSPVPFNLTLPNQQSQASGSAQLPPAPSFTTPIPAPQSFTPQPAQHFNLQPPPPPVQQQQQPPPGFPDGGIAGMDFAELQRLLGPEQFAAIMSGV